MKMWKYKNQILISLGVIVFCAVTWFLIVKTVDNRVSNIEVRVPTIKLPKQEVVIRYIPEGFGPNGPKCNYLPGSASGTPSNLYVEDGSNSHIEFPKFSHIRSEQAASNLPKKIEGFETPGASEDLTCETCSNCLPLDVQSAGGHSKKVDLVCKEKVMDSQAKVGTKVGNTCSSDDDCNVIYSGNICKVDGTCKCNKGSGKFCHLGPINYKELDDMTPEERAEFKSRYWNNMTIKDYLKWLSLYESDSHNLEEVHRKNLMKIKKGGKLTVDDIPKYKSAPPMNAGDYYSSMWCKGNVAIRFPINSETGPFLPSNAGDYSEFIPPSEGIGRPILANQGEKVDPYELDYLIRPRVTTGSERTEIGRRYQQRQKERRDKESIFKDEPWVFHKLDDPEYNLPDEILDKVYYKNFT